MLSRLATNNPSDSSNPDPTSLSENIANVVDLTEEAALEINQRKAKSQYGYEVAIRITPDRRDLKSVVVEFDEPRGDGSEFIGESRDIPLVVDRRDVDQLQGQTVDYRNERFFLV
jgi:Fe-S cluster assembly iron-binding protein IscA